MKAHILTVRTCHLSLRMELDVAAFFLFYDCHLTTQGVAESVDMMSVGDIYELSIPPALAFGSKGRRASAGKPSIPAGAYVTVSSAALCLCCWFICFVSAWASVRVQPRHWV